MDEDITEIITLNDYSELIKRSMPAYLIRLLMQRSIIYIIAILGGAWQAQREIDFGEFEHNTNVFRIYFKPF